MRPWRLQTTLVDMENAAKGKQLGAQRDLEAQDRTAKHEVSMAITALALSIYAQGQPRHMDDSLVSVMKRVRCGQCGGSGAANWNIRQIDRNA